MSADSKSIENLIILVRADPIICGHSTEARNLAEAAIESGINNVHIVSYPLGVLEESGLPLKPIETISPYSPGIHVDRPPMLGDYKVLDGRISLAISGHLVDLIHKLDGHTVLMDLYLVPHGFMIMEAIQSFKLSGLECDVTSIGEAVGSDITNVVGNALRDGKLGAAQIVLSNFLSHDHPVAVSEFTKKLIVESGLAVDKELGTDFGKQLEDRVGISFPAIDAKNYVDLAEQPEKVDAVLAERGLQRDGYVMFLSRISPAKGVDDLLDAWRICKYRGKKRLIICGNGPAKEEIRMRAADLGDVHVLDDVSDIEKGPLLNGCAAYCLPSKPKPEFIETFGIAVAEKMLAGGLGPVITTRTGGIPEATGGHCLEHQAGDVDALCACLDQAHDMSDAERRELSKKAQDFALQFDRKAILEKLLARISD